MRRPLGILIPLVIGAAVLVVGTAYTLLRGDTWQSSATVALAPQAVEADTRIVLLEAFDGAGTLGTYVELLSSANLEEEAGVPPDSIQVRAIPDTRVIEVTATGAEDAVENDLDAVIDQAKTSVPGLRDLWNLETIEAPSAPAMAGPSDLALLVGTGVLSILAAIAAFALIGRFNGTQSGSSDGDALAVGPSRNGPAGTDLLDGNGQKIARSP